jgi:acyl-CoA thioester hydrolase
MYRECRAWVSHITSRDLSYCCDVPEGFHNAHDVRVRFAETDAQGIAHHASYVVWLEVARVAYLADHAGGYRSIREQGIEALTIGVRVDYRAVAVFDDVLTVHVRCVDLRGARFRYEYRIEREGELIATAETLHAIVDGATMRPTRIPPWFAESVARAESASSSPA